MTGRGLFMFIMFPRSSGNFMEQTIGDIASQTARDLAISGVKTQNDVPSRATPVLVGCENDCANLISVTVVDKEF